MAPNRRLKSVPNNAGANVAQAAGILMHGGGKPGQSKAVSQNRRRSAAAAQQAHQLALLAALKSIPKTIAPKHERLAQSLTNLYIAPRGHGYYDAFATSPDAATLSATVGPVTPVQGTGRQLVAGQDPSVFNGHQSNSRVILFNPGSSDSIVGWVMSASASSPTGVTTQEIFSTHFLDMGPTKTDAYTDANFVDGDDNATGTVSMRVESIPLRGSLRLRNITEALSVGGVVRVLRYNGGLNFGEDPHGPTWTPGQYPTRANYDTIVEMVRNSARTRHFSGRELQEGHQVNCYPADLMRAHTFRQDTSFAECLAYPKYSTTIVLIDDFVASSGHNNSYEINYCVHRAARFAPGSLLHSKAITLRSDPNALNRHTHKESESEPLKAIKDGIVKSAQYAPAVARMAEKAGGSAKVMAPYISMMPELAEILSPLL